VVDYYKVLGIGRNASASEVKSAYRRLARQRHPDLNGGTEKAAREFNLIAMAYRTLSDPQERSYYDNQYRKRAGEASESFLRSDNPHARRMRRVAAQSRMDRVVDNLINAERRENFAMQRAVFTTVSLFLSTFFVASFKPRFWQLSNHPDAIFVRPLASHHAAARAFQPLHLSAEVAARPRHR
jgi:curved DNA-binding protein CbpA